MPHRPRSSRRSTASLLLAALAAALMAVVPAEALAQQVGGSIGVSLTVLEPVATQSIEVTAVRLGGDGVATVETTAPTTGPTSHLVMARLTSSASGEAEAPSAATFGGTHRASSDRVAGGDRIRHRLDVGRTPAGATTRDVRLRIEYLAVAGT